MNTPVSLLEVSNLAKRFGGVRAIDNLSFQLSEGGIHSIIGPNGSGKTTLLNLISGMYTPTSGSIHLQGSDVTALRADQLAARGLGRTFQNLQVCMGLTALENVLIGAHLRSHAGLFYGMWGSPSMRRRNQAITAEAIELLHLTGVHAYLDSDASAMPYGALKRLEIARALAGKPRLLLLDEPAAGLNPTEKIELSLLLQRIADTAVTIVLVEHDMRLVMGLSNHIFVLEGGRLLTEGTADEIQHHPGVIAAYLGQAAEERA